MVDDNYDEKRSYTRMQIDTFVTFHLKHGDGENHKGESRDLSANGLKMATDVDLTIGDEIQLTLNSSDTRLPPLVAEGIVVRREVTNEGPHPVYDVSLSFSNIH